MQYKICFTHSVHQYKFSQIPTEQWIMVSYSSNLKCNVEMMIFVGGAVATNYTSATDNLHCLPSTLLGGTQSTATFFTGTAYFPLAYCTVCLHCHWLQTWLGYKVHWHALFDCVCFSKPNPPPGEDLRDSHQHFDSHHPPQPNLF